MKNISLEESCTKGGGETSPRPFSIKSKLIISLDQQCKVLCTLILLYVLVKDYQNIVIPRCRSLAFTTDKAFL